MDSSTEARFARQLGELSRAAENEDALLGVWTDEELAGLGGPGTAPHLPSPWYASLSDDQRQIAVAAGLRSLTARGYYRASPVDERAGTITWEISSELEFLLHLRRSGDRLVIFERTTDPGKDWLVAIRHSGEHWLCEGITTSGYHDLRFVDRHRVVGHVETWLRASELPDTGFRADLPADVSPEQAVHMLPALTRDATSTTTATGLRPAAEPGRDGLSSVRFITGTSMNVIARPTQGGVHYRSASADDWRREIDAVLRGPHGQA